MKPTVLTNAATSVGGGGPATAHASASTNNGNPTNGININLNHDYANNGDSQSYHAQPQQFASASAYGSPRQHVHPSSQQQQYHPQQQHYQQQIPAHFQEFGFDPNMDMDMDMFPRSRLGRMYQDPFANFGGTRKRSSLHDPYSIGNDGFSHYFDDDADFPSFPQFGTLGRRRAAAAAAAAAAGGGGGGGGVGVGGQSNTADQNTHEDDFFNRLPSEFRQYIPESFGHRRTPGATVTTTIPQSTPPPPPQQQQQQPPPSQSGQYYQTYTSSTPPNSAGIQQSPSKRLCDAAIQTEDSSLPLPTTGLSHSNIDEVDHIQRKVDNLNQHGLRNTVDMGVKTVLDNDIHGGQRAQSAPPPPANVPLNAQRQQQQGRATPTQQYVKTTFVPQQQAHAQQKQQTPPPPPSSSSSSSTPQTPGGTYIRTIPIFVEGRSEPIINSHKEIPNQYQGQQGTSATASASARSFTPQQQQSQPNTQQQQYYQQSTPQHTQQQQHRPTPLNTQQQQQQPLQTEGGNIGGVGLPPQTPHTLDSINKIQDIQRDVLELMACVEKFSGTRKDKEYVYIDEMLTRNLLKLDTIDTNGKDSIRLARKEAIKCIQASINVLEAKAEENAKNAAAAAAAPPTDDKIAGVAITNNEKVTEKSSSKDELTKDANTINDDTGEPENVVDMSAAIPLPPPDSMKTVNKNDVAANDVETNIINESNIQTLSDGDKATTTTTTTSSTAIESK